MKPCDLFESQEYKQAMVGLTHEVQHAWIRRRSLNGEEVARLDRDIGTWWVWKNDFWERNGFKGMVKGVWRMGTEVATLTKIPVVLQEDWTLATFPDCSRSHPQINSLHCIHRVVCLNNNFSIVKMGNKLRSTMWKMEKWSYVHSGAPILTIFGILKWWATRHWIPNKTICSTSLTSILYLKGAPSQWILLRMFETADKMTCYFAPSKIFPLLYGCSKLAPQESNDDAQRSSLLVSTTNGSFHGVLDLVYRQNHCICANHLLVKAFLGINNG